MILLHLLLHSGKVVLTKSNNPLVTVEGRDTVCSHCIQFELWLRKLHLFLSLPLLLRNVVRFVLENIIGSYAILGLLREVGSF